MLGFTDVPVRFFIWSSDANQGEGDFIEADEREFLEAEGAIEYERYTGYANGVKQICLTKNPHYRG